MMRQEPTHESHLSIYPLKSEQSTKALSIFSHLLSSCAGPQGKNQMVRNACGGHVTVTSTSVRLLNAILVTRPELKLLVNSVLGHLQECCDCGLFMASLSLQLINNSLHLDIPPFTLNSLFQYFRTIVSDYINSDACKVLVKADFTELQVLLSLTRSILTSKLLLNLKSKDCDTLSHTVLTAFIESIPEQPCRYNSSRMFLLSVDALPVKESFFLKGILLESSELSCYEQDSSLSVKMCKVKEGIESTEVSYIRIAVVSCSMSGDLEEMTDALYEVTDTQSKAVENSVLGTMISFCHKLERQDVGVLLCQKVIHPRVKAVLKSSNILFVERIGSQPLPYLLDLTGCRVISSFLNIGSQLEDHLGKATGVKHHILKNRSYLHISCDDTSVVTLVLCSEWEERSAELQSCVRACLRSLEFLVHKPKLLMGGGCWQAHCSYILKQRIFDKLPDVLDMFSCSELYLRQSLEAFRSSLHHWCRRLVGDEEQLAIDPVSFHAWKVSKGKDTGLTNGNRVNCGCGFKSTVSGNLQDFEIIPSHCSPSFGNQQSENSDKSIVVDNHFNGCIVLDSMTAASSAFHKAVVTAGMLLSVGLFIDDKN